MVGEFEVVSGLGKAKQKICPNCLECLQTVFEVEARKNTGVFGVLAGDGFIRRWFGAVLLDFVER